LYYSILITRFCRGRRFFCIKNNISLEFGIGQTKSELNVLEAIKIFLLNLPGDYLIKRSNSNVVKLYIDKKAKNLTSKPMVKLFVNDLGFIHNVLIPFFDSLNWLSKKEWDYLDWKIIRSFLVEGKHFTEEGKNLIFLINKRMNTRRLSTHLSFIYPDNFESRIQNLIKVPSNYETHEDGRIFIKSNNIYLRGRGRVELALFNDKGLFIRSFDSIKSSASFFEVSEKTIYRRINKELYFLFKNEKFLLKRIKREK